MTGKVRTVGETDEIVMLQARVPLWLKRMIVECAKSRGQDLTEWVKDAVRTAVEAQTGKPAVRPKR